jgi:hypothetical protein
LYRKKRFIQTSGKPAPKPPKAKYTNKANLFHKETIAPLLRSYRYHMKLKNYDQAAEAFEQLRIARKQFRILLARNEKVRIK